MKKVRPLSAENKIILLTNGLDPTNYFLVKNKPKFIVVAHRLTLTPKVIYK